MIEGTAEMWTRAMCLDRHWSPDLDAPRFRAGFIKLAQTCTKWPTPSEFLAAMPAREQLRVTKQPIKATPEQAQRHFDDLAKALRLPPRRRR